MAANTNTSSQPDPETFNGSRRRRDKKLADTSTRREITVRAVWPGRFSAAACTTSTSNATSSAASTTSSTTPTPPPPPSA